jgi:hypothetical protein
MKLISRMHADDMFFVTDDQTEQLTPSFQNLLRALAWMKRQSGKESPHRWATQQYSDDDVRRENHREMS